MKPLNLRQARQKLSSIVSAAKRGESTTIMRRGADVARVVPIEVSGKRRLPSLARFRATISIKGKALSAVVVAARDAERY